MTSVASFADAASTAACDDVASEDFCVGWTGSFALSSSLYLVKMKSSVCIFSCRTTSSLRAGVAVLLREKPRRRTERPNGPFSSGSRLRPISALSGS